MNYETIKKVYIDSPIFSNDDKFLKALKNINPENLDIIKSNEYCQVYFYDNDASKPFALATYVDGVMMAKNFIITKNNLAVGVRETKEIVNISNKYDLVIQKALNDYFGKDKSVHELGKSAFRRRENFVIDLNRVSDGLKAKKISKLKAYQLNICNVNQEIPSFLLSRVENKEKFTRLVIEFDVLNRALNTLDIQYYIVLAVWFFPERPARNNSIQLSASSLKNSKIPCKREKSRYDKDNALNALIENISYTQYLDSNKVSDSVKC